MQPFSRESVLVEERSREIKKPRKLCLRKQLSLLRLALFWG